MTFLQPFILWGLPLILLPIIIHLINRLRHRRQPWGAMRFLLAATRSSTSHAKLRQFLILLFRVLAVVALVFFLSRPLAGGWLGWALSSAPDAIIILLDRSASMSMRNSATGETRLQTALKLLAGTARDFEETSHLVLIDSATRAAKTLASASSLETLSFVSPTDQAADIPAMLQSAVNWLVDNKGGAAEIWIASDGQRENWLVEDARWKSVTAQLEGLPQKVRLRLLHLGQPPGNNSAIAVQEITRRRRGPSAELVAGIDLQRSSLTPGPVSVNFTLDGARSQIEIPAEGQSFRWRHRIDLAQRTNAGWGSFELGVDENVRDNTAYFVFGSDIPVKAAVVSANPGHARFLQLGAASLNTSGATPATLLAPEEINSTSLKDQTLVVWQGPLPTGKAAEELTVFAQEGGVLLFFPPETASTNSFRGLAWGGIEAAEGANGYRVLRWDEGQGPLAKTDEGLSLPLPQTVFLKRQSLIGPRNILAAFEDGAPFLARLTHGRGEIYFCASLPGEEWSSLSEGPVLVPMLQRLLQAGSRRLQQAFAIDCGELSEQEARRGWKSIDATAQAKDPRLHAGIYQLNDRLMAVNRPKAEDDPELLDLNQASRLFGNLSVQLFQEKTARSTQLQGEVWRLFLFAMLVFLIAEGFLILPAKPAARPGPTLKPAVAS